MKIFYGRGVGELFGMKSNKETVKSDNFGASSLKHTRVKAFIVDLILQF